MPAGIVQTLRSYLDYKTRIELYCTTRRQRRLFQERFVKHTEFNIRDVRFFDNVNQPSGQWKRNIRGLCLDKGFKQRLDLSGVPNLTRLHLGRYFNQPLALSGVPNLTELHLGGYFDHPLDLSGVPNLTSLCVGRDFGQHITLGTTTTFACFWSEQRNLVTWIDE